LIESGKQNLYKDVLKYRQLGFLRGSKNARHRTETKSSNLRKRFWSEKEKRKI
jgi:hypothetical protein